jgi:hypothetical protein
MPNKNDKKDLLQFAALVLAAIFGLVWLADYCLAQVQTRYGRQIQNLDANISQYVWEKWSGK